MGPDARYLIVDEAFPATSACFVGRYVQALGQSSQPNGLKAIGLSTGGGRGSPVFDDALLTPRSPEPVVEKVDPFQVRQASCSGRSLWRWHTTLHCITLESDVCSVRLD